MTDLRRVLFAWLPVVSLICALLGPASASADPLTSWTPGPDAALDNTYDGFIDLPALNATVPTGSFTVAGWFVDKTAQGWAGADDIQVWQGTMDGGQMLAKATFGQDRPDVANFEGNPFWSASGFGADIPAGALATGSQTLSVYAHTPGKGWWYKQVQVNVSGAAAPPAAPAPAAAAPTVSAGAAPVLVIEKPASGDSIGTRNPYTLMGYALDKNASASQGSQSTGIDRVSVFVDAERDNGGSSIGDADLAFSDQTAQSTYGSQFANAGWRLTFKPTTLHKGSHTFFIYAHSVVTGREDLETVGFNIFENS